MLGQKTWTRWVVQPKKPNADGIYTYLRFDENHVFEEVEDIFSASQFLSKEEAEHVLSSYASTDEHQVLGIFIKQSAAIFRRNGKTKKEFTTSEY